MRILAGIAVAAMLAGCATAAPAPPPGAQTFTGTVWTWDEAESTVTLMQDGGRLIRVKTTPDQMRTLQLHSRARITGTPAPPADLVITTGTTGPVTAVPKGQADMLELSGTVAAVDPSGRLAVNTTRGPLHLWVAAGADQRFKVGEPVTVRSSVQPVDLVPASTQTTPTPAPVGAPAASPTSEPGDHAVVTGRIVGINPGGVLVVESPTGPIQVLAGEAGRYKVGDAVQVRTTVRAAS